MKTFITSLLILIGASIFIVSCGEDSGSGTNSPNSGGSAAPAFGLNLGIPGVPGNAFGYAQAGLTLLSSFTIPPESEDAWGQAIAISVTNDTPIVSDQRLNDYVAMVGYTVADGTPHPDGNYVFGVLDTDRVGAYSGPNGYVMITRGSIMHMRDESELAGVLGHEMAHVCHHDGLHAIQTAKRSDAVAQAASTAIGNNDRTGAFNCVVDLGLDTIVKKGYDRSQELDADRDAVKYIAAAGYDPAGYERFVNRIADEQGGKQTDLFSTHPGFNERRGVVATAVRDTGRAGQGATMRERFDAETASIRK